MAHLLQILQVAPNDLLIKVIGWLCGAVLSLCGILVGFGKMMHSDNKREMKELKDKVSKLQSTVERLEARDEMFTELRNNKNK